MAAGAPPLPTDPIRVVCPRCQHDYFLETIAVSHEAWHPQRLRPRVSIMFGMAIRKDGVTHRLVCAWCLAHVEVYAGLQGTSVAVMPNPTLATKLWDWFMGRGKRGGPPKTG